MIYKTNDDSIALRDRFDLKEALKVSDEVGHTDDVYKIPDHDGTNTWREYILTPSEPELPLINGPKIYGVRPGSPVLYKVPVTGIQPMRLFAENLPEGLSIENGILTGTIDDEGEYTIRFVAENEVGQDFIDFKIVVGDKIALTPPMGWNSWNAWGGTIDQEKVKIAADAFIELGLAEYGWRYINIDDGWQGGRNTQGYIEPNAKFPDMQKLCDYVHSQGLKIGIYSAPWVNTFQGRVGESEGAGVGIIRNEEKGWYVGEKHFEQQDAAQWAKWGFDYLKYDWHPMDLASGRRMHKALKSVNRDIVYNVTNSIHLEDPQSWVDIAECFYLWRTLPEDSEGGLMAADIQDDWNMVSTIGFNMESWRKYVCPGHWNDPDMLVVGAVGWGQPKPCKLTPHEQYTHISLRAMLCAPLLLGCDFLQTRDEFTLNLLKNREVIDVNQDSLGDMARCVSRSDEIEIWSKNMSDGSSVVGLFNRGQAKSTVELDWDTVEIAGKQTVRDIWRQQDIGDFEDEFKAEVPSHGVILVRLFQS